MSQSKSTKRVTRRDLVAGTGAAGLGGLVLGGAGGFFGGRASADDTTGSAGSGSTKPITIGLGVPVTGELAADGEEMRNGLQLGVDQLNAAGGVLGRQVKIAVLDTKGQSPADLTSAMRKFVADRVSAIFLPQTTYTSVEYPIVAESGIPMFHVNTHQGNVDFVKKKGITNIFMGCPAEKWYGTGFGLVVQDLIDAKAWTPSEKSTAIITGNDPYSLTIAKAYRDYMKEQGWKITLFEEFTAPQADWGPMLVKIRRQPPGIIFFSDYLVSDEASFMKQFAQAPTKSLVYQQYAPSVPEYLKLTGAAANGVIWSTLTGTIVSDDIGKAFIAEYQKRFKRAPGLSTAGAQYDLVRLWARAAAVAGDVDAFERVNEQIAATIFRGVSGSYTFTEGELATSPFPDQIGDPSLGMPHLTFQVQDGKQVLISPDPYTNGKFVLPSWLA